MAFREIEAEHGGQARIALEPGRAAGQPGGFRGKDAEDLGIGEDGEGEIRTRKPQSRQHGER